MLFKQPPLIDYVNISGNKYNEMFCCDIALTSTSDIKRIRTLHTLKDSMDCITVKRITRSINCNYNCYIARYQIKRKALMTVINGKRKTTTINLDFG